MIRKATHSDILSIYEQAVRFNAKYYPVALNPTKTLHWITSIVEDGVALVASKGGFIGGIQVNDPVRDWNVLVEVSWYSEDRTGYYLLKSFIAEAKKLGMDEVRMTTLYTSPRAAVEIVRRSGFTPAETSYSLRL